MECLSHLSALAKILTDSSTESGNIRLPDSIDNEKQSTTPWSGKEAAPVDLLALGSGWTWSFLGPAAGDLGLKTAYTTRAGGAGSIPFTFDPENDDTTPFEALPDAQTIVVIFPLYSAQAARRLVNGYISTRSEAGRSFQMSTSEKAAPSMMTKAATARTRFILLGSTGVWGHGPTVQFTSLSKDDPSSLHFSGPMVDVLKHKHKPKPLPAPWYDRHSEVRPVPRAEGENALLEFNTAKDPVQTSVLCLSGLWGHGRSPRRFIGALAPNKERLAQLKSVHFIHGHDVARAVLAMHNHWDKAAGSRWLLTDERVYDLWDLVSQWGNAGEAGRDHFPQGPQPKWIQELIAQSRQKSDENSSNKSSEPIRALPRTPEMLGYALDSTEFWTTFGLEPAVPWVD